MIDLFKSHSDLITSLLLAVVGYFLMRLVGRQDEHDRRLNNHAQRLAVLDQQVEA